MQKKVVLKIIAFRERMTHGGRMTQEGHQERQNKPDLAIQA